MTENTRPSKNMLIPAINIALVIGYTLYARLSSSSPYGFIDLAFFIGIHFILCLSAAALSETYRRPLMLSALLVVLIGFSTCFIAYR